MCLVNDPQSSRILLKFNLTLSRMLLHAFFAAASSMLYNLTQNPLSPNAISDLNLVEPFLRLLETLAKDTNTLSQSKELVQMHHTCNSLNLKAKMAVQHFGSKSLASFT